MLLWMLGSCVFITEFYDEPAPEASGQVFEETCGSERPVIDALIVETQDDGVVVEVHLTDVDGDLHRGETRIWWDNTLDGTVDLSRQADQIEEVDVSGVPCSRLELVRRYTVYLDPGPVELVVRHIDADDHASAPSQVVSTVVGACGDSAPSIDQAIWRNSSAEAGGPALAFDLVLSDPDGDLSPPATVLVHWDHELDGSVDLATATSVGWPLDFGNGACGSPVAGASLLFDVATVESLTGQALPTNSPIELRFVALDQVGAQLVDASTHTSEPVLIQACIPKQDGGDADAAACTGGEDTGG